MSLFNLIACTENNLTEDMQTPDSDVDVKEICITGKDFTAITWLIMCTVFDESDYI